jgi:benzoyl-CoA reductase/2-hydroxyglutaryl-CoA dehydratase subunit BcrC/BadD/HgdB
VNGVIIEHFISCEPWGVDSVMLKQRLEEVGIPYLLLVRDYIPSQIGQMKTRIEAFLEIIGGVL